MIETPHKIEIIKAGELDIWGKPTNAETLLLEGNLRSSTKVVTNANGEEVVSNYTILFVGYVDVTVNDSIRFQEPNGEVIESLPIQVKFMRGLGGSVAFTKVVL
jgi:hypothetical protein